MTTTINDYNHTDCVPQSVLMTLLDGQALQIYVCLSDGVPGVKLFQDPKKNMPMLIKIARCDRSVLNDSLFHEYMNAWILDAAPEKVVARTSEMQRVARAFGMEFKAPGSAVDIADFARDMLQRAGVKPVEADYSLEDLMLEVPEMDSSDENDDDQVVPDDSDLAVVGCNLLVGDEEKVSDLMIAQHLLNDKSVASDLYKQIFGSEFDAEDPYDYGYCYLLLLKPVVRRRLIAQSIVRNELLPRVMDFPVYEKFRKDWRLEDFDNFVEFTIKAFGVHIRPCNVVIHSDYRRISAYTLFQALDRFYSIRMDGLAVGWDAQAMQFVGFGGGVGIAAMSLGPKGRLVALVFSDDARFMGALRDRIYRRHHVQQLYDLLIAMHDKCKVQGIEIPGLLALRVQMRDVYLELMRYMDSGEAADVSLLQSRFAVVSKTMMHSVVSHDNGREELRLYRNAHPYVEGLFYKV